MKAELPKDAKDPAWGSRARLFNAITHHPATDGLLYSSRKDIEARVYPLMLREIKRQQRKIAWRRKLWDMRHRPKKPTQSR